MRRTAAVVCALALSSFAAAAPLERAPELPSAGFEGLKNSPVEIETPPFSVPGPVPGSVPVSPDDQARPAGLPPIGKWLLDKNEEVAHWLGRRVRGLVLDEPVNVLIRIRTSGSPEAALKKFLAAAKAAGFFPRPGHSNGYSALLDGSARGQEKETFSDKPFLVSNDHFRLFGPVRQGDSYYFSAAISREKVDGFPPTHEYSSFNKARDLFAAKMKAKGGAGIDGRIPLDNAIPDDGIQTTGDHDGSAVLLELPRPSARNKRTPRAAKP
jgi:hypothetical protein